MDDPSRYLADLTPEAFAELLDAAASHEVPALWRARLRHSLEEFCRYCWPERFDLPFNELHDYLFEGQETPSWDQRTETHRWAVAAPRGYAKSTICSFARLVHDIVYGREAYIMLLSATQPLALSLATDLQAALTDQDSRLWRLYGPIEVEGPVSEFRVTVRGRPSVGVTARSFGTQVRGAKHPKRGIRPTKVVIDDGERPDRVRSPEQRHLWWQSLTKDVLKLGSRGGGTLYEVVGTVLHVDSMLSRLLEAPGWNGRRWQAILSWPERADLWEQCGRIWTDLTLGKHREAAARAFYEANRDEMDRGAVVLDPGVEDIFTLYTQIWAEGLASFLQEKQNDPVDPTAQIFYSDRFARFRVVEHRDELYVETLDEKRRRVRVADLRKVLRWDPATGSPHGDFAAIAAVGRDQYGYSFVLDCWMRRARPSEQMAAAWTLAERWGISRGTVESNGFQELVAKPYRRQRAERREKRQFWKLQIDPQPATDNKEHRIATLEPDVTNGWMLFSTTVGREVLRQFDTFPTGDHDDGPDAVHGAWKELGGSPVKMETRR